MNETPCFLLTEHSQNRNKDSINTFLSMLSATQYKVHLISMHTLKDIEQNAFVFVDAKLFSPRDLLSVCMQLSISTNNIFVFNLPDTDNTISPQLLQIGIKGVFNLNDSASNTVKGLSNIKQNKLWFSRRVMETSLRDLLCKPIVINNLQEKASKANKSITSSINTTLTKRELSIVSLVSHGAQNKEIAESLNISINTVKTHIYSIFRKTNCRNRVELMSWSMTKIPNLIE